MKPRTKKEQEEFEKELQEFMDRKDREAAETADRRFKDSSG